MPMVLSVGLAPKGDKPGKGEAEDQPENEEHPAEDDTAMRLKHSAMSDLGEALKAGDSEAATEAMLGFLEACDLYKPPGRSVFSPGDHGIGKKKYGYSEGS